MAHVVYGVREISGGRTEVGDIPFWDILSSYICLLFSFAGHSGLHPTGNVL
jgi:hypothetical protein